MTDKEKLPGSRLSISHLEQIMPVYKDFKETQEIFYPEIENPNTEEIETRAYNTF